VGDDFHLAEVGFQAGIDPAEQVEYTVAKQLVDGFVIGWPTVKDLVDGIDFETSGIEQIAQVHFRPGIEVFVDVVLVVFLLLFDGHHKNDAAAGFELLFQANQYFVGGVHMLKGVVGDYDIAIAVGHVIDRLIGFHTVLDGFCPGGVVDFDAHAFGGIQLGQQVATTAAKVEYAIGWLYVRCEGGSVFTATKKALIALPIKVCFVVIVRLHGRLLVVFMMSKDNRKVGLFKPLNQVISFVEA